MLVEQFRQVLLDSEQLFRQCAQDCLASQPPSSQTNVGRFLSWMDELHKSLLIKVYVFIAEADERWSAEEKQLAEVLFEYIWPCGDHRQNLRDAAGRVFAVANGLESGPPRARGVARYEADSPSRGRPASLCRASA